MGAKKDRQGNDADRECLGGSGAIRARRCTYANNFLDDGLVGGNTGLLQGRNLLTNPSDENKLGALGEIVTSGNTEETIGALVGLEVGNKAGMSIRASTSNDDLLARVVILVASPLERERGSEKQAWIKDHRVFFLTLRTRNLKKACRQLEASFN